MWDRRSLRDSDLGAARHHKGLQTARVHLGGRVITRLELLSALEGPGAVKGGQTCGPPSVCTHSSPIVCEIGRYQRCLKAPQVHDALG